MIKTVLYAVNKVNLTKWTIMNDIKLPTKVDTEHRLEWFSISKDYHCIFTKKVDKGKL